MHESRQWPRPLPRAGKDITITFGEVIDRDAVLEPFRQRWRDLKNKVQRESTIKDSTQAPPSPDALGELTNSELRYGQEASQLRMELTMCMRQEVLKLRRASGLPDEDPKASLANTWAVEGVKGDKGEEGGFPDGSWQKEG